MGASFATHMLLLIWFFTATFCLSFFKAEPHVSCNEKEKQALLTLKRGLTDPGNLLSSWSSDQEDCCRWERVRCDNKIGRVTELHLSSPLDADGLWFDYKKRLGGEISPSLLELGFLNYLNLSFNDFSLSHIPSFLGSMGNLRHLDLRDANFSRPIPHPLGNLSGLRYLDLRWNDFNRAPIPSFLGSMGNLRHLDLHGANFSGLIPHQLGNLSGLRYLDLSFNDFSGLIPHQLGNLSGLQYLDLGYNSDHLYADNLRWISQLSSIQYLGLSSIDLHKEVHWLQIMSKFPSLSDLHLSYCQLDNLNPSLGFINFTSLRVLDLSENHFNHEIPNWFSNLSTTLLQLDLMSSSLKGEIPESLGKLKHLEFLDLSSNSLNGPIPQSLGNLSEIQTLFLAQNQLNGTIPQSLGLLTNLEQLDISNNFLIGPVDEEHFTKLSKLRSLDISHTPLFFNVNSNWVPPFQLQYAGMSSSKIGPKFPTWLQTQKSLRLLLISDSGISDKVPDWFWNWISNIEVLDLSSNRIQGDVSDIVLNSTFLNLRSNHFKGHLPQLSANVQGLNIANNSLSGQISTFLCHTMNRKNKLEVLDASNNLLSGEFSHCCRYWQSLIHLNLGSNNLSGKIPYSMGSLVELQSLRLQNNSISGDIPSSLKMCSSLGLIDIVLSELRFLNLSQNHLTGKIPEKIGNMKVLESVDLLQNHLSGEIPPSMSNLTFLSQLNLSYNNLSGKIPSSTQLQSFDALSYTGNPQLCGDPLPKCTVEEKPPKRTPIGKTEDHFENSNFYMGMGVGFPVGFWAICGILFFKRTWRHAYFKFLDDIQDWVYVTTVPNVNWFLEKLKSHHLSLPPRTKFQFPALSPVMMEDKATFRLECKEACYLAKIIQGNGSKKS
uniref:Uncharacterized protein n=1 Tax=Fagus sylvatica TaxID=28930 RepID=A0A2N9FT33_FAGSY